ncbi:transposase [Streptomyces sp. NPDC059862]|uniref:transposase n=1 Tax=Streptomyces sp. NPDC059862 TaxID=3346975 RepID=UPI00365EF95D
MDAVLRVTPVQGETTWSFLHRVAAAYGLQAHDLTGWWRWVTPVFLRRGLRPDGEVLLNAVAQEQLASWCRVPGGRLARALPTWAYGSAALAGHGGDGQAWARWRVGATRWGPVAFGCRLCAARRGGAAQGVWVYRPRWQPLCARHGRWLLDTGEGHEWEFVDVSGVMQELVRAQRRWAGVARRAEGIGVGPGEVFVLARAVVCGWWEQEAFGEREVVWGARLERVVAATSRFSGVPRWGEQAWRLLARDAVVFPEIVAVADALADPRVQALAVDGRGAGLVRAAGGHEQVAAAVGARLERSWLGEVEHSAPSVLATWTRALARQRQRPSAESPQRRGEGVWEVRVVHRPVEVGEGLRRMAAGTGGGEAGRAATDAGGAWQKELAVPREAGRSAGLLRRRQELFEQGLEHARAHAARHGHLALAHTGRRGEQGFDLGRWLANLRAADNLSTAQVRQLSDLDTWWNPPWPLDWQRAWHRAHAHSRLHGPVHGGDNLAGLPGWLQAWLRRQIGGYHRLHTGQRRLLAQLGLTAAEVERYRAWSGRRRPAAAGLERARSYAARHGHLAVSEPTTADGFALGMWLNMQRHQQRVSGHPTRLGRQLTDVDAWWNPPWPVAWQRAWWAARYHLTGLPHGRAWWPSAPDAEHAAVWLRQQNARRPLLQAGQRALLDDLEQHAADQTAPPWTAWVREVSDDAWRTLAPLMPHQAAGGRWRDHRALVEGIAHIARTGQSWRELPARFGPWQTCYRRYRRWLADGTLHRIATTTLPPADQGWQTALADRLSSSGSG